jgi:hypothetical protein
MPAHTKGSRPTVRRAERDPDASAVNRRQRIRADQEDQFLGRLVFTQVGVSIVCADLLW